jgi:hypothetical protein
VTNTEHFVVIAGNPTKWDREMHDLSKHPKNPRDPDSALVRLQVDQHARGRRGARPCKSIYGWSVRSDTGLDNMELLASARRGDLDGSLEAALAWGIAWAENDPENREFYASKDEVPAEYHLGCEQVRARRARGEQA